MSAGLFSLDYYVNATCWDSSATIQASHTTGKYKTILGLTFLLTVLFLSLHYLVYISLHFLALFSIRYFFVFFTLFSYVGRFLHGSTNSMLSPSKQPYILICPFTTKLPERRSRHYCSNMYTMRTTSLLQKAVCTDVSGCCRTQLSTRVKICRCHQHASLLRDVLDVTPHKRHHPSFLWKLILTRQRYLR